MAVTLVVLSADTDPPPQITFDAPRVVIGRGEGADVRLPDPSVSHRHATLRQRGSDYLVVDEGSTNGTFVGAVRLAPQSPRVLRPGERLRIGRVELEVRFDQAAPVTQSPVATRELALGLVAAALAASGEDLAIRVTAKRKGDESPGGDTPGSGDTPTELFLEELGREYVIGRGQGCDLVLQDPDCSRRHVGVVRRGNGLFVRDLGSKNGALLGDAPLPPRQERPWPPTRELHLGKTVLTYEDALEGALEELERAADEPVTGPGPTPAAPADDADTGELDEFDRALGGVSEAPPAAALPRVAQGPQRPRRPLDPALADFLVGTLAVIVLALSLLGLYWLLGS